MTMIEQELPGMPEKLPPPPPEPFILEGTVESRVDLKIDLAALIRKYPTEYRGVSLAGGFREYERPTRFLDEYIGEHSSPLIFGDPDVTEGWDEFEFDISGRWSEERFEALCAVCPEARITT